MKNQTSQNRNPPQRFFSKTIYRRDLNFGTRIPELLCYRSMKTEPSRDPQSRTISTGSDLGRPPYELVGQARKKSDNVWN